MTPEDFLLSTVTNLRNDGYKVSEVELPSGPAAVGYQGKFRWLWFATKLNLFTVVVARSEANADGLSELISESVAYAKQAKGRLRGLQTGVAVLPILASNVVTPEAIDLAESRPVKGFAAIAIPAIIDLSNGRAHLYEGKFIIGAVYAKWLRERMARALLVR